MRSRLCEACERPLNPRTRGATGVCAECRRGGAEFVRLWSVDLVRGGSTRHEAAEIVGTTTATLNARLRDHRLMTGEAA